MYQTFYSIVFKKRIADDFNFSMTTHDFKIDAISSRENVLMIEANCTPREMIKYLANELGDDVEQIGLIVRNETFEPDWSVVKNSKEA
jgi:hypothetical protein